MMSTVALYASDTPRRTTVEEGSEFTGTVESSCPVAVNGTILGNISAPEITINRSGSISGIIKADRLTSNGTISGNVEAAHVLVTGRVGSQTIIKTSRLEATLRAESGQLEVTFGKSSLEDPESEVVAHDGTEDGTSSSRTTAGGKGRRGRRF
jgi:cytoskeletal protein CcmA (bactofilin family)